MKVSLPLCPPRYPCVLEPDEMGVPSGREYVPFLRASGRARGTNFSFKSEKTGRSIQCLSMGERACAMLLEVNPWVVDYREQYPRTSDKVLATVLENPSGPVLRTRVATFDFVVTYQGRQPTDLNYGVLSIKDTIAEARKEAVRRRLSREQEDALSLGWSWSCIVKEELNRTEVEAAARLIRWGGAFIYRENLDLARELASTIRRADTARTLDDTLGSAARRLAISLDEAYQHFSMAVCFGLIAVDLKKGLGSRLPVHLREA